MTEPTDPVEAARENWKLARWYSFETLAEKHAYQCGVIDGRADERAATRLSAPPRKPPCKPPKETQ